MQPADEMLVCVQREWNGWQTAEVLLRDLQNIHWFQPDRAPRPLVHGYVSCSSLTAGMLPHNCDGTQGPHTLLVCVLKCHIAPSVYEEVTRRAAPINGTSLAACPGLVGGVRLQADLAKSG